MIDKLREGDSTQCPMSRIKQQSEVVKIGCYNIFGKPSIKNTNELGGLNGSIFVDFLNEFQKKLSNMDIISPGEMVDVENLGEGMVRDIIELAFAAQGVKKVSRLAHIIYKKFIQSYISQVPASTHQEKIMYQLNILGFTITFIQAFDAVFLTGVKSIDDIHEWENIKEDMRGTIRNLSRIPSDIQEGLTSSHDRIGYEFGTNKPYMLEHIEEIFSLQALVPEISFAGSYDRIEEKGGYGICPAAVDGTLEEAFEILFDIYGKIMLGAK